MPLFAGGKNLSAGAHAHRGYPPCRRCSFAGEQQPFSRGCPSSLPAARRHLSERDFAAIVEPHFSTNPTRKSNCWRSSTRSARNLTCSPLILSTVLPVMFCARDVFALLRVGFHECTLFSARPTRTARVGFSPSLARERSIAPMHGRKRRDPSGATAMANIAAASRQARACGVEGVSRTRASTELSLHCSVCAD